MAYASGKRSQAISDRSGQAFPYTEMVKEWNGSLVHISEYEPKHPQLIHLITSLMRLLYKILDHKDFNNLLILMGYMLIQAVSWSV
jgi:hypothetical protein